MTKFNMDAKIEAKELTYLPEGNYEFEIGSLHLHEAEDKTERLLVNLTCKEDGEVPVLSLTVTDKKHPERAEGGMKVLQSLITQCGVDTAGALTGCVFDGYICQNTDKETGEIFTNVGVSKGKPVTIAS